MSEPNRYEKSETEEKQRQEREKEDEKQREKQDEKSWDEKWRRDPLGAITWALVLIWAGLVFLADNLGMLSQLQLRPSVIPGIAFVGLRAWPLILLGAGVLVLLEALARVLLPAYRRPVTGTVIWGVVLLGLGLSDYIGWNVIWPIILILAGAILLLRGVIGRK
jgi:hypothetical protein